MAKSRTQIVRRRVAKALGNAQAGIEAGQYDEAHEILEALAATNLRPYEYALVLYYSGYASTEADDLDAALRFFDEALQLSDLPLDFLQTLSELRAKVEQLVNAEEQTAAGSDGANPSAGAKYLPISKVSPLYPREAQMKGIEGSVTLEFTISVLGTVVDPVVVQADPPGYFEEAALNAVKKFIYKPEMVDGWIVAVDGVQAVITFELAD